MPPGDDGALDRLAELIAAGNLPAAEAGGIARETARAALADGFGWVMLYGASCVWSLAALCLLTFGRRRTAPVEAGQI